MEGAALLLLSSGLFLGWTLGANDAANVFGAAVGTRMIRFATAALVCGAFVILGAVVSGAGTTDTLGRLGAVDRQAGAFTCALAAGFTVYYMTKWGLPVSTTQAIVGAIVGWNLFSGSPTDASTFATIVSTWVLCPVLAGLVAVPLFVASRRLLDWANLHLLRVDALMRFALLFAGAFGAYSLGANNIANVMGVFVESTPFEAISLQGGFTLTPAQQLFVLGGVAIAAGVLTYSKRVMFTVGSGIVPMSPLAAWVVVIAHSIVLFAFASEGLERLLAAYGLPTIPLVPVSSSQAVVGAIIGLGMMRGGRDIDWRLVRNVGIGWITTPLVAGLACFIALFFVQNVFDQPVYREKRSALSLEVLDRIGEHPVATKELAQLASHEFTGAPAFLVRDVRGEYRGIRTAGRFLPASGAHRARMTSTPTASETSTHFLSTVMTGTASARPRARHTRSPSDRPLDRVTSRKAPAMQASLSSNGHTTKPSPDRRFRASTSGIPPSDSFTATSERFTAETMPAW